MDLLPVGTHVLCANFVARIDAYESSLYRLYWYYCDSVGDYTWPRSTLQPISDEQAALLLLGSDGTEDV